LSSKTLKRKRKKRINKWILQIKQKFDADFKTVLKQFHKIKEGNAFLRSKNSGLMKRQFFKIVQ